jgi:hypothetical protein
MLKSLLIVVLTTMSFLIKVSISYNKPIGIEVCVSLHAVGTQVCFDVETSIPSPLK